MKHNQIKHHEDEVANVLELITNMSNTLEEDNVVNIVSGKVASAIVSNDTIQAKVIGEHKCETCTSKQLLTREPNLFATLKATKLITFSTMEKNESKNQ